MNPLLRTIDALLITNPTNIRYLTGFTGVADDEREAYLLVTRDEANLFTNRLYLEQAKNLILSNCYIVKLLKTQKRLEIVEISRENSLAKKLAQVLTRLNLAPLQGSTFKGVRLGFEEENLTVAELRKLKKSLKGVTLVPTKDRVEELRMIKQEDEIKNIRQASKLTDLCFNFILGKLKPGVSETEIAWEIEAYIRKQGAQLAFSPIVAFGRNTSQPHYHTEVSYSSSEESSTSREVHKGSSRLCSNNKGNIALLDFGARVNGYCADMTRVVFIGKPKKEWKRAYQTVLKAQLSVLQKLQSCYHVTVHGSRRTNLAGAQLDRLAKNIIRKAGFPPYPHSLGHNVGLDIHEAPRLTIKKDVKLLPDMVFTIEPATYKEGEYGIRIEDLVLLKKDGLEILTKSPKEMIII